MSNRPSYNTNDWVSAHCLAYHDAGSGGTHGSQGHEAAFNEHAVRSSTFHKRLRQRNLRGNRAIGGWL